MSKVRITTHVATTTVDRFKLLAEDLSVRHVGYQTLMDLALKQILNQPDQIIKLIQEVNKRK